MGPLYLFTLLLGKYSEPLKVNFRLASIKTEMSGFSRRSLHETIQLSKFHIWREEYLNRISKKHFGLKNCENGNNNNNNICGPGSSVGIATELRAGRSGIESRWGRDFPPFRTGPVAHPASCKMGTGSFPGVNCGRGVLLTTHPLLVPRSCKSRAIPLPILWATPGL